MFALGGMQTAKAERAPRAPRAISHNLNGQRLGRKGRDTRDRIIAAARALLEAPGSDPITLSGVARAAGLGMSSLYLYFADLPELLIAVLEPVNADAEATHIEALRTRWPDDEIYRQALDFITQFYGFWQRNSRILHLRNSLASHGDKRMTYHRIASASPVVRLIADQMDHDAQQLASPAAAMATVLYAGIERIVMVATDFEEEAQVTGNLVGNIGRYLEAEARLLEFGIREQRATAPQALRT